MKSAQWSGQSGRDQQVNQCLPARAREADVEWEIRQFYNWVGFSVFVLIPELDRVICFLSGLMFAERLFYIKMA